MVVRGRCGVEAPSSAPPTRSFPLDRKNKKGSLLHQLITRAGERGGEVKRMMGILWHSKD